MTYTIKQLAQLSSVSVRTLRWYDEIGLLKPAYYGVNGYRYYEEKQMLLLQQILFFKELEFNLSDIQKLLSQSDFDHVKTLLEHRNILEQDINRKRNLISTIDKTVLRLRGEHTMSDKELYQGFDSTRQKEYEQYLVRYHGTAAEDRLFQSRKRTAKWDKHEWDRVKNQGDELHKDLAKAIEQGLKPDSQTVQAIISRHYQMVAQFYDVSKDVYIGLTELYSEHPDFKKFFDVYHPKMIDFISEAIRFYANKNL